MKSINSDPISLLTAARSDKGFLASATDVTNYKRIWARDGMICGLAALLTGESSLIDTFRATIATLAENQHELGHIPSNINYVDPHKEPEVSYGGLAGRVDTIAWFIIGACNYADVTGDDKFFETMLPHMYKGLQLLEAWEFNNADLIYVPRSGNWADEYITEGHIFYDQVLRLWAMRCLTSLRPDERLDSKILKVTTLIGQNYSAGRSESSYHPLAYKSLTEDRYWVASVSPSGYQTMYDALGNSIALMLELGQDRFRESVTAYCEKLRNKLDLKLLPAFWPPITPDHKDWDALQDNCKYGFRNHPYEFHNGGTWQMVNGFYALAIAADKPAIAKDVLNHISELNAVEDHAYYENFNTKTGDATGVRYCTWSAAGEILAAAATNQKSLLL